MKSIIGSLAVAAAVASGFNAALACLGGVLDVAQPMVDPDHGVVVCTVTYQRMCVPSATIPGYEICFTGEPNCVCDEYTGKSVNINAANILGISATVDTFHMRTSRLFGDTLHAIIDLSHMRPMSDSLMNRLAWLPVNAAIRATVESVLLTAYNHRTGLTGSGHVLSEEVEAKYIWLEIRGSTGIRQSGWGVFLRESRAPAETEAFL